GSFPSLPTIMVFWYVPDIFNFPFPTHGRGGCKLYHFLFVIIANTLIELPKRDTDIVWQLKHGAVFNFGAYHAGSVDSPLSIP
ncbi:MAG: hypothetical protein ACOC43_09980, partial [Desulfohalobiaceae bacterium]